MEFLLSSVIGSIMFWLGWVIGNQAGVWKGRQQATEEWTKTMKAIIAEKKKNE